MPHSSPVSHSRWRTPLIMILAGCLIGLITAGPRSAAGQFLTPLSFAHGWGRDVFSLAIAIQNIVWGLGQPLAGAVADRFGVSRVLSVGAVQTTPRSLLNCCTIPIHLRSLATSSSS